MPTPLSSLPPCSCFVAAADAVLARIYMQFVLFVLANANFEIQFCYSNGERNNKLPNEITLNTVGYPVIVAFEKVLPKFYCINRACPTA